MEDLKEGKEEYLAATVKVVQYGKVELSLGNSLVRSGQSDYVVEVMPNGNQTSKKVILIPKATTQRIEISL